VASKKEIGQLQKLVLRAALTGGSLPGSNQAIRFPDLEFFLRQPAIFVVKEGLAGSLTVKDSPRPIRILPRKSLVEETRTQDNLAYLEFHHRLSDDETLDLTLEGKIQPRDPNQALLGLSSIHVTFKKVDGKWLVSGEPSFSAA
jgi:hypothetical protein